MKLTFTSFILWLFTWVHALQDINHGSNNQRFRIEVLEPNDPASGNAVRIKVFYNSPNIFADENKGVGAIWTVSEDGVPFPNDSVSNGFAFISLCDNSAGCGPTSPDYYVMLAKATFDGKN